MHKRFFNDEGKVERSPLLSLLAAHIHQLYAYWIAQNAFNRDFSVALDHATHLIEAHWAIHPACNFQTEKLELVSLPLPPASFHNGTPPLRFYTDDGELSPHVSTAKFLPVLVPFFVEWLQSGYLLKDFHVACQYFATHVVYDHGICKDLGGLGGCKTETTFFSEAYSFSS